MMKMSKGTRQILSQWIRKCLSKRRKWSVIEDFHVRSINHCILADECRLYLHIPTQLLSWNHLLFVSLQYILPSVCRIWDYKAELKIPLLDLMPSEVHLLENLEVFDLLFAGEVYLTTHHFAFQCLFRKMLFSIQYWVVPLLNFPEYFVRLSV